MPASKTLSWLHSDEAAERFSDEGWPFLVAYLDPGQLDGIWNQIRRAFDAIRQIAGINTYTDTAGVSISPPDSNITSEEVYNQAIVLGDGQGLPPGLHPEALVIRLPGYKPELDKFTVEGDRDGGRVRGNADEQVLAKQEELIKNSLRYTKELLAEMEQHWESQPGWDDGGSSTGSSSDTSRPPQKTGLAPAAGKADIESGLQSDDSRNASVKDDDQEKKHNPNAGRKTLQTGGGADELSDEEDENDPDSFRLVGQSLAGG